MAGPGAGRGAVDGGGAGGAVWGGGVRSLAYMRTLSPCKCASQSAMLPQIHNHQTVSLNAR